MALNKEQKELLKQIVSDKFAIGAWTGMVYNAKIANPNASLEYLMELALEVRLKAVELAK